MNDFQNGLRLCLQITMYSLITLSLYSATELYSNGVFPSIHWFRRHLIRLIVGGSGVLPLHDHTRAPPLLPSGILRIRRVDFDSVVLSSLNWHATAALADLGDVEGAVRHMRPVPDRQVEVHVDVWKHRFV
ncbi:hypothetical protein K438DRAFT_2012010 [Mycena galopus ATCC 62051]|nr:hypothetical protein K438DRAFT_2012010 [Mycena galopus ATCC 62051]